MSKNFYKPTIRDLLTPPFTSCLIPFLILFSTSVLICIWPLPGTIALRNLLLSFCFICSIIYLWNFQALLTSYRSWNLWLFILFFAWLAIHLAFFSTEFEAQKNELLSVWLRSFISIPCGLSLGIILNSAIENERISKNRIPHQLSELAFFLSLNGTGIIFFLKYLLYSIQTEQLIHHNFFQFSYLAKTPFVISCALVLPLSYIYILSLFNGEKKKYWPLLLSASFFLSLFSIYFANTKNGFVIFFICLVQFIIYCTYKSNFQIAIRSRFIFLIIVLIGTFLTGAYLHIKENPSWLRMMTEIRHGLDIEKQQRWKDPEKFSLPTYDDGTSVNGSAYERTAWFIAGLQLTLKSPEGYGLLTHSFGRLAKKEWPDFNRPRIGKTYVATHSGWLDMTLAVGLIGMFFIWVPMWSAWYRSLVGRGLFNKYVSWSAPIIFIAYLVSEVAGAHFTELLFFLIALYIGITLQPPSKRIVPQDFSLSPKRPYK